MNDHREVFPVVAFQYGRNRVENFARDIFLHYSSFSGKSSGLIKMGWEPLCVMGEGGEGDRYSRVLYARECNEPMYSVRKEVE